MVRRFSLSVVVAIVIAIVLTTIIYILVAVAALGNLTPAQIQQDQEYVLAVAARPTLGQAGFALIGLAALLSTDSAINATLFGAARLALVMAREHAPPAVFALPPPPPVLLPRLPSPTPSSSSLLGPSPQLPLPFLFPPSLPVAFPLASFFPSPFLSPSFSSLLLSFSSLSFPAPPSHSR